MSYFIRSCASLIAQRADIIAGAYEPTEEESTPLEEDEEEEEEEEGAEGDKKGKSA